MLPDIGEIKRRRSRLGLRQAELAHLAGVSQSLIAKTEGGRMDPAYSKAKAIFEALERNEEGESLVARDVMTRKVLQAHANDRVADVVAIMKSKGISQLPVLDGDNAIGMVSDASILERFGDDPAALSSSRIGNIMGDPPPRVDERTPLAVLSALLRHSPAVLIVKKEKVVGIVTKADLLKAVSR